VSDGWRVPRTAEAFPRFILDRSRPFRANPAFIANRRRREFFRPFPGTPRSARAALASRPQPTPERVKVKPERREHPELRPAGDACAPEKQTTCEAGVAVTCYSCFDIHVVPAGEPSDRSLTVVLAIGRDLIAVLFRSRAAVIAENLFLRRQLALYLERQTRRRRPSPRIVKKLEPLTTK